MSRFDQGRPIPSMRELKKLAKELQKRFPNELKQAYEAQKKVNPELDKEVDEWMKEVEEMDDE